MQLLSKLGLGTVQFGLTYGISNTQGQTSAEEVSRILKLCERYGITILDTAHAYGDAEAVLGQNNLVPFRVVSKFLAPESPISLKEQFRKTLAALNVNKLYAYLAHRPEEILSSPWQWEELERLIDQGLVMKRGFSLNHPQELISLLDRNFIPDLVQVPFNYLDNRFEKLLVQLKNAGCEVHARSAFLQGLFFKKPNTLPAFFDEVKPVINKLHQFQALSGALLKFVLEKSFIDTVIVGVENAEQLKENIVEIEDAPALPPMALMLSDKILVPSNWPSK